MKTPYVLATLLTALVAAAGPIACAASQPASMRPIAAPPATQKPPFDFKTSDESFLDEVQRGCFLFLWHECSPKTGMVVDRTSVAFASIAGVGFQLSALPIGVERGWVPRDDARDRAKLILESLAKNPANRHEGLFFHFLDPDDAGPSRTAYEHVVSTIDSAILFAGMITAGEYFGGDVKKIAEQLVSEANWRAFVLENAHKPYESGFISLGYRADAKRPNKPGLLPFVWADAGDEQRLVTFLAVGATKPEFGVEPELYYKLRRRLGTYDKIGGPVVWFPWSGALFTSFFAHCWIDYAALGVDDPAKFGVKHRTPTDWWENARRMVRLHQVKAEENPRGLPTFSRNAWGLSASDAPNGYAVPGLFPDPMPMPEATPNVDFADHPGKDDYGTGTIAPYAAGSSILFDPERSVAALRYYRGLKGGDGSPLAWREPDVAAREYGFRDAFNLAGPWIAADYVAIDQGPLILCIENARTGLVWNLFSRSAVGKRGFERLGMRAPAIHKVR